MVDNERRQQIFNRTIAQNLSDDWMRERFLRITASNIGEVAKMTKRCNRMKKVYSIAYPMDISRNKAVQHGIQFENEAFKEIETTQNLTLDKSGLIVSFATPYIAASPDGLVFDPQLKIFTYTLEIKCPLNGSDLTIQDVINDCLSQTKGKRKLKYLDYDEMTEKFSLRKQHNYYYQVQCQMYVSQL